MALAKWLNVESLALKRGRGAFYWGETRVRNPIRKVTYSLSGPGHSASFARLIMTLLLCCAFSGSVSAHDISQSESRLEVHGHEVRVAFRLNLLELGYVDANGNGFISYDELDNSIDRVYTDIKRHYVLQGPAPPIQVTLERYGVVEDHVLDAEILYEFSREVTQLRVTSTLYEITRPGHQHLTSANLNGTIHETVLNAANPTALFSSGDATIVKTFWSFFCLGIMHIFTGYDHLAFLVGLLIVTTSLGSLVKIITSFTVAHSITLALATFNIVVLPTRLTESVIALSIVYVALENLLGIRAIQRYRITFLFGLAHGFGFSNVLREWIFLDSILDCHCFRSTLASKSGSSRSFLCCFR